MSKGHESSEASDRPLVSVAVNYYNPDDNPRVLAMIQFTMESLATHTEYPLELILADGSGKKSEYLAEMCGKRGWKYVLCPDKGAFAKIYNMGLESATGEYLVWMASDIFVTRGWEKRLIEEMRRTGAWMAAPYLTNADYMPQTRYWPVRMYTFRPHSMTFNLNMITRECFERIGGMDPQFTGNFNDVDYLTRIRQAGGEAIIVDAGQILHVARATSSVMSTFKWDQDLDRFLAKYPELKTSRPSLYSYNVRSPLLSQSAAFRFFLTLIEKLLPDRAGNVAYRMLLRMEPVFHKC